MAMIDIAVPEDLEGTKSVVRNWLKNIGDTVAADEALVELETDKVAMEGFAPIAGVLQEIGLASGPDPAAGALPRPLAAGAPDTPPPAVAPAAPAAPRPGPAPGTGQP